MTNMLALLTMPLSLKEVSWMDGVVEELELVSSSIFCRSSSTAKYSNGKMILKVNCH